MTNPQIIEENRLLLVATGVIKEDNIINTYIGWKRKGFQVKEGAEHVAAFPIWHPRTKKKNQTEEEAVEEQTKKGRFYLATAYWFTDEQVKPAEEK